MNKHFQAFFESYNMSVEKNSAYGKIRGYEVSALIDSFDNVSPLKLHVSFYATDEQRRNIETSIRNLALKFFNMHFTPYGLSLGFNGITVRGMLGKLPDILDNIFNIISQNGATTAEYCPVCGNRLGEAEYKQCNIDGFKITIDTACVETINAVISEENKDFNEAPNNYLMGSVGAVIGGIVGAALAIGLYMLGYVSALSAIVSVVLGAFLFQKFHGKPDKVMIIIVSVITLVFMIASIFGIYIVAAGIAANEEGLYISAIDAFGICMENEEFSRIFYLDLALSVVFSAVGIGLEIAVLAKQIKRKQNI